MKLVLFSFLAFKCLVRAAESPPHIIVIIGDDIGWNDFSFHGTNQIFTPNIDALGYNGVFLNKFYTQAICSPSRAALLTGKYPMRYGYQGIPLSCGEDRPLPHDIPLLPERLKKLGYSTHLVGKWHLSAARAVDTPTARGFDTHFGYWYGFIGYFDYFAYQTLTAKDYNFSAVWSGLDLHEGLKPQWQYQGQYATDLFTTKSLQIIDNHNASKPLFLYLGHLAAHTGANGTELGVPNATAVQEKYGYITDPSRRNYADVVNRLDSSIGQVVKKLNDKGMLENSVVVFLSDNGAQTKGMFENFGSNYPLKGEKFTLLEGGVRGSAVIYSPLLSKKGYINNHLMHITDLNPTLIKLAGESPCLFQNIDGVNQWNSISENSLSKRTDILLNIDKENGFSGIIGTAGRYKYLNGSYLNGSYDPAFPEFGDTTPPPDYNVEQVIKSDVNQAIQSIKGSKILTPETILELRSQLDIRSCKGKVRKQDLPCLGECLFDLENDPCETENIVDAEPQVKETLKAKLDLYLSESVPSRKAKIDMNSFPGNCNQAWFLWLDADGCYSNNIES